MRNTSNPVFLKSFTLAAGITAALSTQVASAQCPAVNNMPKGLTAAGKDMRSEHTQPWCDPVCSQVTTNGTSCKNAAGQSVTTLGVCNDATQSIESIKDIEYNMCIDIDDRFISEAGYNGQPPGTDYQISTTDAAFFFAVLFSKDSNGNGVIDGAEVASARDSGWQLTNELNLNGDNTITRGEAGQSKGADPCQLLSTGFSSGLATDDILSYIGMYLGDPMIDKYAGDLEGEDGIKEKLLTFSRTWQPSYWKNNGSSIAQNPSSVHSHWDGQYSGNNSRRVCDSGYNGPYKELYNAVKGGQPVTSNPASRTPPASNPPRPNNPPRTNNPPPQPSNPVQAPPSNNGGSGMDQYRSANCGASSHPYWCSSMGACFDEEQMRNYCGVSGSSNANAARPVQSAPVQSAPQNNSGNNLTPSNNCGGSHPYWCASRGQCFTQDQMNNYCQ